jgi:Uma2 family endonuclease
MTTTPFIQENALTNGQVHHTNGVAQYAEELIPEGHYVTEEQYWAAYYDRGDVSYEWNNGYLEEKPVADYAQFCVYLWVLGLLKDFLHVRPIGRMIGLEMGFRMAHWNRVVVRKPDLAVVLNSNPTPLRDKDRSYRGIFDLCIESLSDSTQKEVERDTVTKRLEYAAAGVKEYFILDERRKETAFYELTPSGVYVPIKAVGGVIHAKVLPGFRFRLADLYRMPEPPALVADPVYRDFVSPFLRAERERAEQALELAEQERERAEQEYDRAEQERERAAQERARAEAATQQVHLATQQLLQERTRADEALAQAARYAALLKSMGVAVDGE